MQVAESYCSQSGSGLLKVTFVLAQLRDMFAAEDSPVVSKENDNCGTLLPQRAQPNFTASGFG